MLLAGSLAAQQAPEASALTKTKTKRTKSNAGSAAAMPAAGTLPTPAPGMAAPGLPPMPPVGGPGLAPPPVPGTLPLGRGPQPGPGPQPSGVQALSDFSGTLTGYRANNDDQVYDRFALKTSTGTDTVRFPRHLGQALLAAAKPGSAVTVTGFRTVGPEGRPSLHLVSLTAGGQTLRDVPPTPPTTPPTAETVTVSGTVQRLAQNPAGRATAAILTDGTVLRLPPPAAEQLADKLKVGASVAATGTLRAAAPGESAARPVRVVHPQTLTLNGVQFLVR